MPEPSGDGVTQPPVVAAEGTRQRVSSGGPFEEIYGYCRAVRVGDQIHVSGTTATDPHVDDADAYQQAVAALAIVERALDEIGSSLAAVVRTVTYLTDMSDFELVARAHREVFQHIRPAATLVEVSRLVDPRLKVEFEVYAVEPAAPAPDEPAQRDGGGAAGARHG